MRLITSAAEIERVGGALVRRAGDWASVAGVAGSGFEAYARILHPVEVTDEHGRRRSVPWSQIAEVTGAVMHPQVQWWAVVGRTPDEYGDCYSLTLANGWDVSANSEGRLEPAVMADLTTLLARHTPGDEVFAGIWNGWGELHGTGAALYLAVSDGPDPPAPPVSTRLLDPAVSQACTDGPHLDWPGRDLLVFTTSLTELADPDYGYRCGIGWDRRFEWGPTPAMVWPQGLDWVVATEIDWNWTIVAGSRGLIAAVLEDPRFEAYEVAESDPLTIESDTVNRPRD